MADYIEPFPETRESLQQLHLAVLGFYLNCAAVVDDMRTAGGLPTPDSEEFAVFERVAESVRDLRRDAVRGFPEMFIWFSRAQDERPQQIADEPRPTSIHDRAFMLAEQLLLAIEAFLDDDEESLQAAIDFDGEPMGNQDIIQELLVNEAARALNIFSKDRRPSSAFTGVAPLPDGPVEGYRWRHLGEIITEEMQPAAWRLASALWAKPDRSSPFDDLIEPVYQDPEHLADSDAFGSLRRAANGYFRLHGIPLQVTLKRGVASLVTNQ
jgi:hypothetical protein